MSDRLRATVYEEKGFSEEDFFSRVTNLHEKRYEKWTRKGSIEPKMRDIRKSLYHVSGDAPICILVDRIQSEEY